MQQNIKTIAAFFLGVCVSLLGVYIYIQKQSNKSIMINNKETGHDAPVLDANYQNKVYISDILPSGTIFKQGEGAMIPISWNVVGLIPESKLYVSLMKGQDILGRITNSQNCDQGGDFMNIPNSVNLIKWDGLFVCSNWQSHSVQPGYYKIIVEVYQNNVRMFYGESKDQFKLE